MIEGGGCLPGSIDVDVAASPDGGDGCARACAGAAGLFTTAAGSRRDRSGGGPDEYIARGGEGGGHGAYELLA